MIAKGNLHGDGGKLAQYLMNGQGDEHVEFVEARRLDYLSRDPAQAFKTLQQFADANTKAEMPFFHSQTRLAGGEHLTNAQWMQVVDREEKRLGFAGQPRLVTFHVFPNGEKHLHVAWFRIDMETMKAIDPGMYKNHLKQLSRKLEKEFALREVSNHRKPEDRARPGNRKEVEEARRLGTDDRAIRNTILDCLERTDGGKAFRAALDERGLMLSNGDRRDCFVVIDQSGGHHTLNKRLTGMTLAAMRDRLSDLDRTALPGVNQAKAMQKEKYPEFAQQQGKGLDPAQPEPRPAPQQRDAGEEGVKPEARHPAYAPEPAAATIKEPERIAPRGKAAAEIYATWGQSPTPAAFMSAMQDQGYKLARVTPEEARESHRAHALASEAGRSSPRYRDGEIVVVNDRGWTYRLNEKSTGAERADILKFTAELKSTDLPSMGDATKAQLAENSRQKAVNKEDAWQHRDISKMEMKIRGFQEKAERGGGTVTAGLFAEGLTLARVDAAGKSEVERDNQRRFDNDRLAGKTDARLRQSPKEGELVAVTRSGTVFRLNPRFVDTDKLERAVSGGREQKTPTLTAARQFFATTMQQKKDDRAAVQDERYQKRQEPFVGKGRGSAGFKVNVKGAAVSLSSFVESLFGMGKASTPASQQQDGQQHAPQGGRGASGDDAWEEIYEAVKHGRDIPADSIRHLPPSDLQNLRSHGDAVINDKIMMMEREKRRDLEHSWEEHGRGRELER